MSQDDNLTCMYLQQAPKHPIAAIYPTSPRLEKSFVPSFRTTRFSSWVTNFSFALLWWVRAQMSLLQIKKRANQDLPRESRHWALLVQRESWNSIVLALLSEHMYKINDVTLSSIVQFYAEVKKTDKIQLGKSRNGKCSKMLLCASCSNCIMRALEV